MYALRVIIRLLLFAIVLCVAQPSYAQEEDVKSRAAELFDKEDYAAAFPLYSQLLANYPKDPNYNYRFGVCMLYGNADKAKSLPYLEFASKSPDPEVEVDVWFYLGRAYQLNYRFDDAIKTYAKYRTLAGNKKAEKKQIDNQIAMCKTGKKLLKAITDIEVIEKKELARSDFFRSYDLSSYSGQLLVKPDDFKTSLDNKKNETSVIFLSGEKNELYFSSYGNDEENGKDIYVVRRLPNGSWSKPQSVGYPINTEYDEDYPFLHPNGKVLYFSSKGHSSMGGYDIFRSDLNEETNTWQKPVNLDFAINSPDDDILYITDLEEKTAYFASSRNSPDGSITVYRVKIERKPVEFCIIKGNFAPLESSPSRSARILVKNAENDEIIGVFKSNEASGSYLINLPNGGKFSFTVEKNGMETQTEQVVVPPQYQIKPVRQEIGYRENKGKQQLYITTYFNDDSLGLPPEYLRDKAKLELNDSTTIVLQDEKGLPIVTRVAPIKPSSIYSEERIDTASATVDTAFSITEVPSSPTTKLDNAELVKIAFQDAQISQSEAKALQLEYDRALTYVNELNELTHEKQNQANDARKSGNTQQADQLQAEANALQMQIVAAYSYTDAVGRDAKEKAKEAEQDQNYAAKLEDAVKSKTPGAIEKLNADQQQLSENDQGRSEAKVTVANLKSEVQTKKAAAEKIQTQITDLKAEIDQASKQAEQLRTDAKTEKNAELKQGMLDQADGIDEDIALNKQELSKLETKATRLNNEASLAEQQYIGAAKASSQSQNSAYAVVSFDANGLEKLQNDVREYERQVGDLSIAALPKQTEKPSDPQPVDSIKENTTVATTVQGTEKQPESSTTQQQENPNVQTADPSNNSVVVAKESIASNFSEQLEQTTSETDPVRRENRKAEIYTDWVKALDSTLATKKAEAAASSEPAKKQRLNEEITGLEKERDKVQEQATQASAKAQELQKAVAVVPESQPTTTPVTNPVNTPDETITSANRPTATSINNRFEDNLKATNQQADLQTRQKEQIELYKNWADTLEAAAQLRDKLAENTNDVRQKESLKVEAEDLRVQTDAKRKLAEQRQAEINTPPATAVSTIKPAEQEGNTGQEIPYTTAAATLSLKARENQLEQAKELRNRRDSLNNQAANTSGDEKDRLLQEATDVQRQIWEKEMSAAEQLGAANTFQYNENRSALSGYQNASKGSDNAQAESAQLLIEEAENLFSEAAKNRETASNSKNNPFVRDENLRKAEVNEELALKKQQQAIDRYKKAGFQPIAIATTDQKPADTSTNQSNAQQSSNTQTTTTTVTELPPNQTVKTNSSKDIPVVQSGPGASIISKLANTYNQQLNTVNEIADEATRERRRAEVYDNWAGSLDSVVQAKQSLVEIMSDEQQKNQFKLEIANLQRELDQRQGQASAAIVKAQEIDFASGKTADNTTPSANTDNTSSTSTDNTAKQTNPIQPTTENTVAEIDTVNSGFTKQNNSVDPFDESGEPKIVGVVINPSTGAPFEADELEAVRNAPSYQSYVKAAREADDAEIEAASQQRQAAKYEASANAHIAEAQAFADKASTETNATQKKNYFDQAAAENNEAKRDMAKRDSMLELSGNTAISAKSKRSEANLFLQNVSSPLLEQIKVVTKAEQIGNPKLPDATSIAGKTSTPASSNTAVASQQNTTTSPTTSPTQNSRPTSPPVQNNAVSPTSTTTLTQSSAKLISGEEFRIGNPVARTKPIPVDPPLPEGLVFKVQVGAFRNPLPANAFNTISPIAAETTPQGFTRYTAGLFLKFGTANSAKTEIRKIGYSDAFVVAFYNGKRISLAEALKLAGETVSPEVLADAAGSSRINNSVTNANSTSGTGAVNSSQTNTADQAVSTTDVAEVTGLFYTVQVGVFSRPVTNGKLNNLNSLFSERTSNGSIRYSSGKYSSLSQASQAKPGIIEKGISDAFVTAYYNGKRISIAEAQRIEREGGTNSGNSAGQTTQATSTDPSNNAGQSQQSTQPGNQRSGAFTQADAITFSKAVNNASPITDSGTVYCVQLGAFRELIPVDVANQFLLFADRGVQHYVDTANGYTVFLIAPVRTYEEASKLREEATGKGITDAFIVAWRNGKKIPINQARGLNGN